MRRGLRVAALILFCGGVLSARGRAEACSVDRVLTAQEVAEAATVVVRARADKYLPPSPSKGYASGRVLFRILERIKGEWPSEFWVGYGRVDEYHGANPGGVPYTSVRPGGLRGSCFAYDYRLGKEYLLFLYEGDVQWAPMAPINEEVSGPSDAWVLWVKKRLR